MSQLTEFDDDLRQELLLALVPGVGPLMRRRLLDRFGSAPAIFEAHPDLLQGVDGIGPTLARRISKAPEEVDVDEQIEVAAAGSVKILLESHEDYPPLLKEIPDPPGVLFVKGSLLEGDRLAIGIVGTLLV